MKDASKIVFFFIFIHYFLFVAADVAMFSKTTLSLYANYQAKRASRNELNAIKYLNDGIDDSNREKNKFLSIQRETLPVSVPVLNSTSESGDSGNECSNNDNGDIDVKCADIFNDSRETVTPHFNGSNGFVNHDISDETKEEMKEIAHTETGSSITEKGSKTQMNGIALPTSLTSSPSVTQNKNLNILDFQNTNVQRILSQTDFNNIKKILDTDRGEQGVVTDSKNENNHDSTDKVGDLNGDANGNNGNSDKNVGKNGKNGKGKDKKGGKVVEKKDLKESVAVSTTSTVAASGAAVTIAAATAVINQSTTAADVHGVVASESSPVKACDDEKACIDSGNATVTSVTSIIMDVNNIDYNIENTTDNESDNCHTENNSQSNDNNNNDSDQTVATTRLASISPALPEEHSLERSSEYCLLEKIRSLEKEEQQLIFKLVKV